jgi:hypothetical protein
LGFRVPSQPGETVVASEDFGELGIVKIKIPIKRCF